jgi:hypothetical protein
MGRPTPAVARDARHGRTAPRSTRYRLLAAAALLVAVASAASGCESGGPRGEASKTSAPAVNSSAMVGQVKAATTAPGAPPAQFGAPLGKSPVVALSDIVRDSSKYAKTTVKTEGKVTAICQAAGCWMEITDANGEAHVRMSGHSFFVPKSASGRRARVEGTVLPKPDNGECEQEALEATGKTVKVELDATGVELL